MTQRLHPIPSWFVRFDVVVALTLALAAPGCGGETDILPIPTSAASSGSGGGADTSSASTGVASAGVGGEAGGATNGAGGAGGASNVGGSASVPVCANGTAASYVGTSCSQGDTVYHWQSYACTAMPPSLCDPLGPNGENFRMTMDPNGPHTILAGGSPALAVGKNAMLHVTIVGTVSGSPGNLNWPHFGGTAGNPAHATTLDGTEENITTVGCAASGDCLDALQGKSDILCSPTSSPANCSDQATDAIYEPYHARFNPAPAAHPYPLKIEIILTGNQGTAMLKNVGTHL